LSVVATPKAKTLILIEAFNGKPEDLPDEPEKIKDRYIYATLKLGLIANVLHIATATYSGSQPTLDSLIGTHSRFS